MRRFIVRTLFYIAVCVDFTVGVHSDSERNELENLAVDVLVNQLGVAPVDPSSKGPDNRSNSEPFEPLPSQEEPIDDPDSYYNTESYEAQSRAKNKGKAVASKDSDDDDDHSEDDGNEDGNAEGFSDEDMVENELSLTKIRFDESNSEYFRCGLIKQQVRDEKFFSECHSTFELLVKRRLKHLNKVGRAINLWMGILAEVFLSPNYKIDKFFTRKYIRKDNFLITELDKSLRVSNLFIRSYIKRAFYLGDGLCLHLQIQPLNDLNKIMAEQVASLDSSPLGYFIRSLLISDEPKYPSYFLLHAIKHLCIKFYEHPIGERNVYKDLEEAPNHERSYISRRAYIENEINRFNKEFTVKRAYLCSWERHYRAKRINYEMSIIVTQSQQDLELVERVNLITECHVSKCRKAALNINGPKRLWNQLLFSFSSIRNHRSRLLNKLKIRSGTNDFRSQFDFFTRREASDIRFAIDLQQKLKFYMDGSQLCSEYFDSKKVFSEENEFLSTIELFLNLFSLPGYRPKKTTTAMKAFLHYAVCEELQTLPLNVARKGDYEESEIKLSNEKKAIEKRKRDHPEHSTVHKKSKEHISEKGGHSGKGLVRGFDLNLLPPEDLDDVDFDAQPSDEVGTLRPEDVKAIKQMLNASEAESAYEKCSSKSYFKRDKADFFNECEKNFKQWVEGKLARLDLVEVAINRWMRILKDYLANRKKGVIQFFNVAMLRLDSDLDSKLRGSLYSDNEFVDEYLKRSYTVGDGICLHIHTQPLSDIWSILDAELKFKENFFPAKLESQVRTSNEGIPSYFLLYAIQHICKKFYEHPKYESDFFSSKILPFAPSSSRMSVNPKLYMDDELKAAKEFLKEEGCSWYKHYRLRRLYDVTRSLISKDQRVFKKLVTERVSKFEKKCASPKKRSATLIGLNYARLDNLHRSLYSALINAPVSDRPFLGEIKIRGIGESFREKFIIYTTMKADMNETKLRLYSDGGSFCQHDDLGGNIFSSENKYLDTIELYSSLFLIPGYKPRQITSSLTFFLHHQLCEITQLLPVNLNRKILWNNEGRYESEDEPDFQDESDTMSD